MKRWREEELKRCLGVMWIMHQEKVMVCLAMLEYLVDRRLVARSKVG